MTVYGIVRWVDEDHEVAELMLPVHPTRAAAEVRAQSLREFSDDEVRVVVLGL